MQRQIFRPGLVVNADQNQHFRDLEPGHHHGERPGNCVLSAHGAGFMRSRGGGKSKTRDDCQRRQMRVTEKAKSWFDKLLVPYL
jgi:hypothetical protein